jgi:hypothetical protein
VHHRDRAAGDQQGGERGAHAAQLGIGVDPVPQLVVGGGDGFVESPDHGLVRHVAVEFGEFGDDDAAGQVARGHAAHPVGDRQQPRARVHGVLVGRPDQAGIRAHRIPQRQPHENQASPLDNSKAQWRR